MSSPELTEIALFPIPNMVTFPKAIVPLHVFEPRYRKLIQDCLQEKRRIGVCHILKVLHRGEKHDKLEDKLKSNQDTYEPQPIFSAGFAELKETTEDGRFMINVHMDGRFELVEKLQEVPYQIYRCREYGDEEFDSARALEKREQLDRFLLKFADKNGSGEIQKMVDDSSWKEMPIDEYSLHLFNMLHFDAEISQTILEMKSSAERLEFACRILNIF